VGGIEYAGARRASRVPWWEPGGAKFCEEPWHKRYQLREAVGGAKRTFYQRVGKLSQAELREKGIIRRG